MKFMISILMLALVWCSAFTTTMLTYAKDAKRQSQRGENLLAPLKRVQMRIYRGPDAGQNTQYGYFIRQPSFD